MTGLPTKDFLVLQRRYGRLQGLAVVGALLAVFVFFPSQSAIYVPMLLALMMVAPLAELLFALLMMIVGVPAAYFCKGEVAAASMMGMIVLVMLARYSGILITGPSSDWRGAPLHRAGRAEQTGKGRLWRPFPSE